MKDPAWFVVAARRDVAARCKRFGSPNSILERSVELLEALSALEYPLSWAPSFGDSSPIATAQRRFAACALDAQLSKERAANG